MFTLFLGLQSKYSIPDFFHLIRISLCIIYQANVRRNTEIINPTLSGSRTVCRTGLQSLLRSICFFFFFPH